MTTIITTHSGIEVDLLRPTPEMINIDDIAHSLSMQCRFNGHVPHFYSVAQHCISASKMVEDKYALTALLHDASEAYLGDMITPLKLLNPFYCELEVRFEEVIAFKFGLLYPFPAAVTKADNVMLYAEQQWRNGEIEIPYKDPETAKREFLIQFNRLMPKIE